VKRERRHIHYSLEWILLKVLEILLHLLHIHWDQLMVPKLEELVLVLLVL
jgi:hypothetical protein